MACLGSCPVPLMTEHLRTTQAKIERFVRGSGPIGDYQTAPPGQRLWNSNYHQQYLDRNKNGYCSLGETGSLGTPGLGKEMSHGSLVVVVSLGLRGGFSPRVIAGVQLSRASASSAPLGLVSASSASTWAKWRAAAR
jgi:hypothetical protein